MAKAKVSTKVAEAKVLNTGTESVIKETDLKEKLPEIANEIKGSRQDEIRKNDVSQETPVPQEAGNKVEVDSDVLQNILTELNDLKTKQSQLEQTSSQDQIRKIEALRASGKLVKAVKLRRVDGLLVLAWKMVVDDVYYADGKVHERQEYEVVFEDGTKKTMDIREFTRKAQYESHEVIKEARLADGRVEYTVQMPDGKELVINETYVN